MPESIRGRRETRPGPVSRRWRDGICRGAGFLLLLSALALPSGCSSPGHGLPDVRYDAVTLDSGLSARLMPAEQQALAGLLSVIPEKPVESIFWSRHERPLYQSDLLAHMEVLRHSDMLARRENSRWLMKRYDRFLSAWADADLKEGDEALKALEQGWERASMGQIPQIERQRRGFAAAAASLRALSAQVKTMAGTRRLDAGRIEGFGLLFEMEAVKINQARALKRALKLAPENPLVVLASAEAAGGLPREGEAADALQWQELYPRALELLKKYPDRELQIRAERGYGKMLSEPGELRDRERAIHHLRRSVTLSRKNSNKAELAQSLGYLAGGMLRLYWTEWEAYQFELHVRLQEKRNKEDRDLTNVRYGRCYLLDPGRTETGDIFRPDDLADIADVARENLSVARSEGDGRQGEGGQGKRERKADALLLLAAVTLDLVPQEAEQAAREALSLTKKPGTRRASFAVLAKVLLYTDRLQEARSVLEQAMTIKPASDKAINTAYILHKLEFERLTKCIDRLEKEQRR